jgi:hypothetical protein
MIPENFSLYETAKAVNSERYVYTVMSFGISCSQHFEESAVVAFGRVSAA